MPDGLRLSVLDQSPIRAGGTAREALLATIELARAADRLGYSRYWLAEHHNSRTLASASSPSGTRRSLEPLPSTRTTPMS